MNNQLVRHVLQCAIDAGVKEFCIAPGKRNAPFMYALAHSKELKIYYWPEERSAAFFALGRARATGRPVAVVTTSGTAAAQLLPAAMEAYYTHQPLLLLTADRPRNLRGTGAPQCAEQVGLFSYYARYMQDIAASEICNLAKWTQLGPAHLNVCFEEPTETVCEELCQDDLKYTPYTPLKTEKVRWSLALFNDFIKNVHHPLVVVGALEIEDRERVTQFLMRLRAPIYAEAPSGLREEPRLAAWQVGIEQVWQRAAKCGYPIDGVLRIGSIPTGRIWRDLDDKQGSVKVCSVSDLPFSGLSWTDSIYTPLSDFFDEVNKIDSNRHYDCEAWIALERKAEEKLNELFYAEPSAEASLIHHLSKQIPNNSLVYLGNSLPIREWDLAATKESKQFNVTANRGVCGIDGQISTFLGLCSQAQSNWGIIGDLTALFDMVGPWILPQLSDFNVNLVIVNNGGGQIFSRMFNHTAFLNAHQLNFEHLAHFWKWRYEKWDLIPKHINNVEGGRMIEIVPEAAATSRFLTQLKQL